MSNVGELAINPSFLFNAPAHGFAQAIRTGDTIYCSGQVSTAEGLEAQARDAFTNVRSLLAYAGATMSDIVKLPSTRPTLIAGRRPSRCATSFSSRLTRPRRWSTSPASPCRSSRLKLMRRP